MSWVRDFLIDFFYINGVNNGHEGNQLKGLVGEHPPLWRETNETSFFFVFVLNFSSLLDFPSISHRSCFWAPCAHPKLCDIKHQTRREGFWPLAPLDTPPQGTQWLFVFWDLTLFRRQCGEMYWHYFNQAPVCCWRCVFPQQNSLTCWNMLGEIFLQAPKQNNRGNECVCVNFTSWKLAQRSGFMILSCCSWQNVACSFVVNCTLLQTAVQNDKSLI